MVFPLLALFIMLLIESCTVSNLVLLHQAEASIRTQTMQHIFAASLCILRVADSFRSFAALYFLYPPILFAMTIFAVECFKMSYSQNGSAVGTL